MYIIELSIEIQNMKLNQLYTYLSEDILYKGQRVEIEFNNRKLIGFIINVKESLLEYNELEKLLGYKLKYINKIIDNEPILNDELIDLAISMHIDTVSPLISCLNTILPPNLKSKSTKQKIVYEKWVKRTNKFKTNLTKKQALALDYLDKEMYYKDYRGMFLSVASKLVKEGYVEVFLKEKQYNLIDKKTYKELETLNNEQTNALNKLKENNKIALLHGVTGSGKTEVYLSYAMDVINNNKQVFILLQEISLTTQMLNRVTSLFQDDVAIYHSGLTNNEKYEQYLKIKNNQVKIVVGTRSSIFLPFNNIGLIVIDEEHDSSYKQDVAPCYHTIDVAIKRAQYHNAKVILGSATPSLLSYSKAIKKVYDYIELKERVFKYNPDIELIDIKKAALNKENIIITNRLLECINDTISNDKQVLILLNRRGYYPILKCDKCNKALTCPKCDISLNYHHDTKSLKCHMCDYELKGNKECNHCKNNSFSTYGYGTQKVEHLLQELLPNINIERMDADTIKYKNAHKDILDRFENKQTQILIGTQMIAKGLDFKDVTLVGILNADSGLNRSDYRSCENIFNLITQASGRSGRHTQGKVIIQVENINHYVLDACYKQDYKLFFTNEMNYRHTLLYPPYSYLCAIYITDINIDKCTRTINYLIEKCYNYNLEFYQPIKLHRINNINRYRLLIKSTNLQQMKSNIYLLIKEYYNTNNNCKIKVDINPYNLG